ncbi:hypothetical protein [Paracidovorax anthurii]|uniref:Uncharacterized protein n=1 Tax=Paracidovorax anthurii TaxID=78229 RepID=A0A328YXV4_9BURK|nr:hypothetical protein [Paracidovorax anthurii]RAR77983.1 hypothetical protein AX018_103321 [Paracidovorax anthurii]WCM94179.1 hypothetical protein M5C99_05475 [Acidovorax sp. NCPPB 2350]
MSNYDAALVLDAGTLNKGMTQLYGNAQARQKFFQGTEAVGQMGITSVDWSIDAAPQFVLAPPTLTQWNDPHTFTPSGQTKPPQPTDQMFQVQLASVTTTFNLQDGTKSKLNFALTVFAQVTVSNRQIQLGPVAVLPINPTGASEFMLQVMCGIVFTKVQDLLKAYQIPPCITIEGQDFTPPVVTVTGSHLVLASNLLANGTPDISGVQWPQKPLGVLVGRRLLSTLLQKYSSALVQKMDDAKINKSDSNWTGSYSLNGGISNASVALGSTLPNVNVSATFAATAEVGVSWWLVPAACAVEAASNLL